MNLLNNKEASEKTNLQLTNYLYEKTDKIKCLIDDVEIPDDYKADNIKSNEMFSKIVEENKTIVDEAFKIIVEMQQKEKDYSGPKSNMNQEWTEFEKIIKNKYNKIPNEIKSLFDIDI